MFDRCLQQVKDRSAAVAVVGLGYVGLPLILRVSEVGYKCVGLDVDQHKVDMLTEGQSYISHVPAARVRNAVKSGMRCTSDFSALADADVIILCLPTPLNRNREPDLSYVKNTVSEVKNRLRKGQLISLESTTYPGTSNEIIVNAVQGSGLVVGEDVFVVYSPEREDPGNKDYSTEKIPKVCGGKTESCLQLGVSFYEQLVTSVVPVSSLECAEMTKLLENIHRSVNIGLVNEMKIVADAMGVDIHEVVDAAATKPFGFTAYKPGPGLGGHCIPIDPFYLTWKAREYGLNTRFIELAGEINTSMPSWVVGKIVSGLNSISRSAKGSKVLILGVAYKKNVDDMREAPSLHIMEQLERLGAEVDYCDPYVKKLTPTRAHSIEKISKEFCGEVLASYDVVVLVTDHDEFDSELVISSSGLIVDTRGAIQRGSENVIRA